MTAATHTGAHTGAHDRKSADASPAAAAAAPVPQPGTLYLVPTPLDFGCESTAPIAHVLPEQTLRTAARLGHWICENAKSCRAFLKRVDAVVPLAAPLQSLHVQELPHHVHKSGDHAGAVQGHGPRAQARKDTDRQGANGQRSAAQMRPARASRSLARVGGGDTALDAPALLAPALAGQDMGLVSEAGMPAVADPGSSIVRAAHEAGIPVVPLVGPVSLLLALAASGLNGQSFAFTGYLPQDASERAQRIQALESLALRHGQTQLFIETPYRNPALWQALLRTLSPHTRLLMASGLTLPGARIHCHSVQHWREHPPREADGQPVAPQRNVPVVFGIGV